MTGVFYLLKAMKKEANKKVAFSSKHFSKLLQMADSPLDDEDCETSSREIHFWKRIQNTSIGTSAKL